MRSTRADDLLIIDELGFVPLSKTGAKAHAKPAAMARYHAGQWPHFGPRLTNAVGKDVVSRAWRKVKVDWEAWCGRSLAGEDIVRLILDATVIRTRLDKKAPNISVLAAIGVCRDGQNILLSIRHMGGESTAAWRQFLDARGLKRPDSSSSTVRPGSRPRSPHCGARSCRSSAAPCTSTATCSAMRRSACTTS